MKEDRRIKRTKSAIKRAFIKLLQQKDLDKITVSDITNEADINRGTFYLHYEDKYILLEDMENEYISQLSNSSQFKDIKGSSSEDIANTFVENVLIPSLQHIYDNLDFYHTIFKIERTSRIETEINQHISKNIKQNISINHKVKDIPEMYFFSYVSGATISIIKYWVLDEHRISVNELARHIHQIVYYGPLRLMAENRLNKSQLH